MSTDDYRGGCGVEVGETLISTGGYELGTPTTKDMPNILRHGDTNSRYVDTWTPASTVTRYSLDGSVKFLPHLSVSRANHACATYINENGQNVS